VGVFVSISINDSRNNNDQDLKHPAWDERKKKFGTLENDLKYLIIEDQ